MEKLTRFEGEILKEFFRLNRDVKKIIHLRRINKRWCKVAGK